MSDELIEEVMREIHGPLNEEWTDKCLEDLQEWIGVYGDKTVDLFVEHFNFNVMMAQSRYLGLVKGD